MLSVENFTASDREVLRRLPKNFKVNFFAFTLISVPLCFLFGLFGLFKKSSSAYWQTTVMLLVASTVAFLYILLKEFLAYRKDIKFQTKLMGTVIVTSKSDKSTIVQTDSKQLKKLSIPSKRIFDQIEIGDTLTIGIAMHTKWLLQLKKNGNDLLSAK